MSTLNLPDGVEVTGPVKDRYDEILSPKALELVAKLHRELNSRRLELLAAREDKVKKVAAGEDLDFLPETKHIREDDSWKVAPLAPGLEDRRVEMTGPTDRKMVINALNSGAAAWLADQEDANTPMWENVVEGPMNLMDAVDGNIDFTSPEGKEYKLVAPQKQPTIIVRPRGWHLPEKHILVDGQETSGSLVDFALYLTACGQKQIDRGKGPYFYCPKMESHLEARLWNDAFVIGQDFLGIHNLMEDAATAEISRSQIWQQIKNEVTTADTNKLITKELVLELVDEVIAELPGDASDYDDAKATFLEVAVADDYANFLTLPAYERMK